MTDKYNQVPQTPIPTPPPTEFKPIDANQTEQGTSPYVVSPMPVAPDQQQSQPGNVNVNPGSSPQMVYVARPLQPEKPPMNEETRQRHEESKRQYPNLNLSEGEFVVRDVKRHIIGLIEIWGAVGILAIMSLFFFTMVTAGGMLGSNIEPQAVGFAVLMLLLLNALFFVGGIIATKVYLGNRFYLTNESVIQVIQHSLFSKREQTVSLANVEDASFLQNGILQHVLNYGSIRLSTEGEETTYRYNYVANPGNQLEVLNNAVEAFKNGRPVDPHDN